MSNELLDRTTHSRRGDGITDYLGGRRPTMPASDSNLDIDLASALTDGDRAMEESPPDATVRVRMFVGGPAAAASLLPRISGYELLDELGRGGMGVVYKAWQHSLKRTVALKMILGGSFVGERDLERFRAEAMAIARLHHPNLVNIYEIGEHDLLPFYSMEYMEGGSLSRRLHGQPVEPRCAAELVRSLAQAMDYAHNHGIVHRDLKPANILLSGNLDTPLGQCVPKITDFGIAKLLNENNHFTRTGDILGTPHYMAPEQALGRSELIGPASDVYSLGAILYELLTGRPPFQGDNAADILLRLTKEDPDSPTRFIRGLPRDLVTICMKCLEKTPEKRYASASALAEDINRYLRNEPILAIPTPLLVRAAKWTRRRPVLSTMLAMAVSIVVLSFTLLGMMYRQAVDHNSTQDESLIRQDYLLADAYLDRGYHLAKDGDVRRGMHWMARALKVAESVERRQQKPVPLTQAIRMNLAAWGECVGTTPKMLSHRDWVWDLAFTRDGETAITASSDSTVRLWNAKTGQAVGKPIQHASPVWGLAVHPDGRTFFTICGDRLGKAGSIYVWNRNGDNPTEYVPRGEPMAFPHELFRMQMNTQGDRIWVSSAHQGLAYLIRYDPAMPGNGLAVVGKPMPGKHLQGVFSDDGQTLATVRATSVDEKGQQLERVVPTSQVQLWNGRTAEPIGEALAHAGPVRSIVFTRDNRHLLAGCSLSHSREHGESSALYVWDRSTRSLASKTPPLPGRIKTSAAAPNRRLAAVSSYNFVDNAKRNGINVTSGHVQVWLIHGDGQIEPQGSPMATDHVVWSIDFSPDSRMLLAGCENFHAYLWSVTNGKNLQMPVWHEGNCVKVCFSPDGRRALTGAAGGTFNASARLWDVPKFSHLGPPLFHSTTIRTMLWEPDGKHAWIGCGHQHHRWNPETAELKEEFSFKNHSYRTHGANENPHWIVAFDDGEFSTFDPRNRALRSIARIPSRPDFSVEYQKPSQLFLSVRYSSAEFQFFRFDGKPATRILRDSALDLHAFAVSPDGNLLAASYADRQRQHHVALYDIKNDLQIVYKSDLKSLPTYALTFSADGTSLMMGGADQQVQRFDVASKEFIGTPLLHEGAITYIGFARNDQLLITRNNRDVLFVWDIVSSKRIGPAFEQRIDAELIGIHPQGDSVLVGTRGKMAMNWRIPHPVKGSVNEIRAWVESITAMEMKENDTIHPIHGSR